MKVLQIITSLGIGGAEHLVTEFALRMRPLGVTTDVVVLNGLASFYREQLEKEGIRVISLGEGPIWSVYNPLHLFRLARLLSRYDLAHVHLSAAQYWTALAATLFGIKTPLVTTEHSPANRRRKIPLFSTLDRWLYRRFRAVVCISPDTSRNLKNYLGDQIASLQVIPNGVDLDRLDAALPYSRLELLQVPGVECLVVNVAGFRSEKDQDTLIRAMKRLPDDTHLALVGDGVRRKQLEQLVRAEAVEHRVHFLGRRDDVPRILKSADLVVMSSHWEGLSLASIEGLASGSPFVASDVTGLREVVADAGILFRPGDSGDFVAKIAPLRNDPLFRAEVVGRCRERASRYDLKITLREYVQLYKTLLP